MYQLTTPIAPQTESQCIKRIADNAIIPFDNQNTDYVAYLAWLAEGNEPSPPDEPKD
jgi:hypothetical protein